MMTKCSSLLQKVRNDIKKTSLCHDVKSFVMTSKIRQMFVMKSKIRHDVKKPVMTSKTCHDVKKIAMRQKHVETSKFWHQFYISTMCRPPVINDYVFSTNLVTLTIRPIPVVVLYPDMSIDSFVTIRPHLTKLCCDIMLRTHIHTQRQTDRHAAETLVL